ncbi:hypothetical protein H6P81_007545 [Aristolochia fimbriata]|uniref:Far-red elongated hypocotyl 1 n=1 Tax=Aristolochia fimbriata TaxID=158543 RepID=A0AAV7F1U4_ARIFI|nr:hypothetical protein H6P81_007545 [Aristolochia fimbriata]
MEGDQKIWKPFVIGSFPPLEVLHVDIHYISRKRKFQDEQGDHPGQKPRLEDESCESDVYAGSSADPRSSQTESCQDSNSFIEEYQTAVYVDVDSHDLAAAYDQNSSSSRDHGDAFISSLYSLESRTSKTKPGYHAKERHCTDVEDAASFETRRGSSKKQLNGYGMNYAEFMCSEYGIGDEEQLPELTAEEMMLYSNDIGPHLYLLSSGAVGTNSEAQSAARKPTIDQEFEQYFATLML